MKVCPKCQARVDDNNIFCQVCGTNLENPGDIKADSVPLPEWDHSAEFDARDISENKVVAMLIYITGLWGALLYLAILWLLGKNRSDYLAFHVKENFKLALLEIVILIISLALCFTVLVPIIGAILECIIVILRIIAFVSVAKNEAKEVALIRNLGFLK
ncbi:MAG: zinc-ribbon domain-containing protein [Lachnospiraceae bacterium]|nr:zinc-ribbon domain-containing protein [Lachnospiraceae bacterium]